MSHSSFLAIGADAPLAIVHEDPWLIAVNKPAGQLVHGYTKGLPRTLIDQVKAHIALKYNKRGNVYLGVTQRLDRPVSGVILFSRNSKIAGRLGLLVQERKLEKHYLAVIVGELNSREGTLEDYLTPLPQTKDDATEILARDPQLCRLHYEAVHVSGGQSLIKIRLETGRRHQIRRQLQHHGTPIFGDTAYGFEGVFPGCEGRDPRFAPIALHAASLSLIHPQTRQAIEFRAPVPDYWEVFGKDFTQTP